MPDTWRPWPFTSYTRESSGLRSWARPAGFQEAAVPSSETATKALAIPAARAPEPARLRETPSWAWAGPLPASTKAPRQPPLGIEAWRSIDGAACPHGRPPAHGRHEGPQPPERGHRGHAGRGRPRRPAGDGQGHPRRALPLHLQRFLAAPGHDRLGPGLGPGRAGLLHRPLPALPGAGGARRRG